MMAFLAPYQLSFIIIIFFNLFILVFIFFKYSFVCFFFLTIILSLDQAANYKCEVKRIYSCLLPDQIAKCTSFPAIILSQKGT